jgi:tRNA modification GTPase
VTTPATTSGEPTFLACLTPPGTAAIATLAIRGPDAWRLVRELFTPLKRRVDVDRPSGSPLPDVPTQGRIWLGRLGAGHQEADEIVLTVRETQPWTCLELHCHGGREVVSWLQELFAARGARVVSWIDFARATMPETWRAEALEVLASAPTARTAAILLDQYHGACDRVIRSAIDYLGSGDVVQARRLLEELGQRDALGRHLVEPWRVVIAGAPNVGKSSLVNALAGFQRSVVDVMPGTTRDVVTTRLAIDGWPIEVADTAGWHEATEPIERAGIGRARDAVAQADLCVWVLDASEQPIGTQMPNVRYVINKIDLAPAWPLERKADGVRVSARTGAGLAGFCDALSQWLVPNPPPAGGAVPFTAVWRDRIAAARESLTNARIEDAMAILRDSRTDFNPSRGARTD